MKIRAKILWTLLGMLSLVTIAAIVAVNRLQAAASISATKEARDVARLMGLLALPGTNKFSESAAQIVAKLRETQGRDVVLLNSDQIVVADSLPSRVGKPLTEGPSDGIGMTIKDRRVRTFVEVGKDYPAGVKRIVVPVESQSGQVVGAVVLRYAPLYDELMRLTSPTRGPLIWAGFGSIAIAVWLALYAGGSLVRPLRQLTIAATGFATGRTDLLMPRARKDEVGDLATAFTDMIHLRERAEDELRRLHDDDRVAELAKTSVAVSAGNAKRMRAEETLRESEEKFRQLADQITDVFWITSADLATVHYVSPGYETTWGRSPGSLYGDAQERTKAILPEDRERVYTVFRGLMGKVPKVSVEYRIARPDGSVRWIHDRGFQVRDAAGCLVCLNGIASDITESKQIEEALRRQQTELRVLIDLTPALICFKDANNRILRVNQRFAEFLGKSVEEIEGKSILEIDPQEGEKVFGDDFQVIHSGTPKLGSIGTIRDSKGQAISVQTDKVPVFDKDKKVIGIVVMCQDITQRKSAEETLRLLNSAVLQSRESIVITDAELDLPGPRIVFVNPAFTKMTGYAAEEVIGKTPRILQGPRTDQAVTNRLRQDLQRGELFEGEVINYRKDGTEFTLEWQAAPIRDEEGRITHFLALQRDVTARKRLESQMFQSQKMETVGRLAGGVAHEFNSIMTAIIGQSELLIHDLLPGSALAESAIEISKAAIRAATLTRQLLAFGRRQFLQPETINLNRLIANMESVFHHLMGGGVRIQIVCGPGLQAVKADAEQIEQVIINMAMNARDAMPNGGLLTLETANMSFDQEIVGRNPELRPGDYVMLAITDTGLGMSSEVKARVFEPFFSTKEAGQGTGLGLSTCYGIVKQSGGHISVYSEPARGATFKIFLPQIEPQTQKIPIRSPDLPRLPHGTETVLLVEDDPALREMAAILLRRLGYLVFTASNGVEALSLKQQRNCPHIDLLFTDLVMPHMSGKELSERMRASYPHTRILFTSAYTETSIIHHGIFEKGPAHLQKPFTPSALAHKLREVLDLPIAP